ncbi:RNA polymerase sigma factor [Nocardioides sp. Kera G14]|uniref:RNA polymerase sigma factor n=1 Tax=Nocardioides sp. Kera G14 TaxID=2884264 RepID=UPI001D10D02A|nr:sigma-70 family RNA polymerase sigma factor [Nocardioides sp. Kera G14]UDY25129.1 sigma-70 family RNA polymerase sigma factor [Nocardioides sp. Kera G14]
MSTTAPSDLADFYVLACPPLIGYLTVLTGNAADAEEVAQEAFVRLWQRWSTVQHYDNPSAWLRQVATRLAINRFRRSKVAVLALPRLRTVDHYEIDDPDVDLTRALGTLPIEQRAVVLLHHLHDLPLTEVASLLDIPSGTAKSRLARARTALAPLLDRSEA